MGALWRLFDTGCSSSKAAGVMGATALARYPPGHTPRFLPPAYLDLRLAKL